MNSVFHQLIASATNILLVSHRHPDADTIGANSALHLFLKQSGKNVDSFCIDPIPERLQFHPVTTTFLNNAETLSLEKYDLIIIVDCGSIQLTGIETLLQNKPPACKTVNIDHHQDNGKFSDVNLVDITASSTSEIVYSLIKQSELVNKDITECLLMGIMYDTSFFTNGATTTAAIRAVSDFLSTGASLKKAVNFLWKNKSAATIKLWGRAFARLVKDEQTALVWTYVTQQDLTELQLEGFSHADMANYLTSIRDAKMLLLLIEGTDGNARGSLRTTRDDVDVAAIAQKFGGGGHKKAAGFNWVGKIDAFEPKQLF